MDWIVQKLWLIPVLPLAGGGAQRLLKQRQRKLAASLAIGSMVLAFLLSLCAFSATPSAPRRERRVPRGGQLLLVPVRRSAMAARLRLGARPADGGHAGDGLVGRPAHLHLQPRLHGARRELHAVLLLPVAVRRRDARAGHRQQPAAAVHLLGNRRPDLLPADRLLVSQTQRGGGGQEGLHHHAHRRPRPCCWAWCGSTRNRHAALLRRRPRLPRTIRACRDWSRRPRASAWRSRPASGC